MICAHCTLFHPTYTPFCQGCGRPLTCSVQRTGEQIGKYTPVAVGVTSGLGLLGCMTLTLLDPSAAGAALDLGSYFGIISIANIWLSVVRGEETELLRGMRGMGYSLALLISLVGELARLQHVGGMPLPAGGSVPAPSALATEILAATLIIFDPLVLRPLLRWVEAGVEYGEPAYRCADE